MQSQCTRCLSSMFPPVEPRSCEFCKDFVVTKERLHGYTSSSGTSLPVSGVSARPANHEERAIIQARRDATYGG